MHKFAGIVFPYTCILQLLQCQMEITNPCGTKTLLLRHFPRVFLSLKFSVTISRNFSTIFLNLKRRSWDFLWSRLEALLNSESRHFAVCVHCGMKKAMFSESRNYLGYFNSLFTATSPLVAWDYKADCWAPWGGLPNMFLWSYCLQLAYLRDFPQLCAHRHLPPGIHLGDCSTIAISLPQDWSEQMSPSMWQWRHKAFITVWESLRNKTR